jgi:cell division septation protein DedD
MASSSRRSAGDRVLESKHVIGLFLLMLVFSGIFFTLGYVMGRNQYDGQVRAAGSAATAEPVLKRTDPATQNSSRKSPPVATPSVETDPALKSDPSWEFPSNNQPVRSEPRLEAPPKNISPQPSAKTVSPKTAPPPTVPVPAPSAKQGKNNLNAPLIPSGAIVLQVAALVKQEDALAIAGNLQKKHFSAYVQMPQKDKFFRVQVGPFKDKKAADAAKKGLENEGFKAFYAVH